MTDEAQLGVGVEQMGRIDAKSHIHCNERAENSIGGQAGPPR